MSIATPLKQILRFKVPGVLALGILAGQLIIGGLPSGEHHNCKITVERPHVSTYLKERQNKATLKLNIKTECDAPQKYTILNADIQAIINNSQVTAHQFSAELRTPVKNIQTEARFEDLRVDCASSEPTLYLGRAWGEVHLTNGEIKEVSGNSGNFVSQDCKINAK